MQEYLTSKSHHDWISEMDSHILTVYDRINASPWELFGTRLASAV